MGADMLVAVTAIPMDVEPDWHAAHLHIWRADAVAELDAHDIFYDESLEDVQHQLTRDLLELKRYFNGGYHRQFAELYVAGHCLILTGGLSWGDSPTDAYELLDRLTSAGALHAAGFDPPEFWTDRPPPRSHDISREDLLFP